MPPKRNRPLRDQQGLAMILVLCLGALFVALAAALVYAASLMMANSPAVAHRRPPAAGAGRLRAGRQLLRRAGAGIAALHRR